MTSKLEEAAQNYLGFIMREGLWRSVPRDDFRAGAQWLARELKSLAFPNNTEDQVIRLSDLEKIVGEE